MYLNIPMTVNIIRTTLITTFITVMFLLAACSSGSNNDNIGDGENDIIVNGLPVSDTIQAGEIQQYAFSVDLGTTYQLTLTPVTGQATFVVCSTAPCSESTNPDIATATSIGNGVVSATFIASFSGNVYLAISSANTIDYVLRINSDNNNVVVDEGQSDSPKNITNTLPYSGFLPNSDANAHYVLNDLVAGEDYYISLLKTTADFDLALYSDKFSTAITCNVLDNTNKIGSGREGCIFTAPGDSVYMLVDSTVAFFGGSYLILFGEPFHSEGTSLSPIQLNNSAATTGQVDNFTQSYYLFTGLEKETVYQVTFDQITDRIDVNTHLYGYNPGTAYSCDAVSNLSAQRVCYVSTGNSDFVDYNVVFEVFSRSVAGTEYTISTLDAIGSTIFSEGGSANPKDITLSLPHYNASVNNLSNTHYLISDLSPNTAYTVSMIDLSAEAGFRLFNTPGYFSGAEICSTSLLNADDKTCSGLSDENGNLWIWVNGQFSSYGAVFTLNIGE